MIHVVGLDTEYAVADNEARNLNTAIINAIITTDSTVKIEKRVNGHTVATIYYSQIHRKFHIFGMIRGRNIIRDTLGSALDQLVRY